MKAAASTFKHSFGLGPNPPYGTQQAHGSHQPAPGPSGAPRPEEQQQYNRPFFYIQPQQPCIPMQSMQWPVPMPVSYNPYYAYPGLGYGMPMMPHYQPNPYMEPPSFVLPHTHLHLMDYRRMLNPQYYQTMAYHSRRFRYQQNSQTRETTSSEVQTEPLSATQRTSTLGFNDTEGPSGLLVRNSDNSPSVPVNQPLSSALDVHKGDHSLELKEMVPPSTTRTPANGSFVIQTEEVRIECCTTPGGLQLLHSHESAEVSHRFSRDMVQCSSSILQGHVLQDEGLCLSADETEQALQACPDILLVGTPSSDEKNPTLEESKNQMDPLTAASDFASRVADYDGAQEMSSEKNQSTISNFKVADLPFDPKYLDELWKMESTVWSMDETLIPSPESLIQNGRTESHDEKLAGVADVLSADVLTLRAEAPTEEVITMIEMTPLAENEQEDVVSTVKKGPGDEMVSEADMCPMLDLPVAEKDPMTESTHTVEVALAPNLPLLDNSPLKVGRNQQRLNVQDHQDTSFESLPAYLPSTSWMADYDNVYYCTKMPPTPKKQNRTLSNHGLDVPTRRRKLDLEYKEQPSVRKPKQRYKPKGKVDRRSLSDHECCLNRNFNENAFIPYASKRERLCSRCVAKSDICRSASPGLDGRTLKRKAALVQQWNDALLPTCEVCKSHSKKRQTRKGSSPDNRGSHGRDTDGESSENSSCRKWRPADHPRNFNLKRPLASKQIEEKCPAVMHPKLREKNCVCDEPRHQSVAWERLRHCPHGNTIREMDENCAMPLPLQDKWRVMDQSYLTHKWQTEKSRRAVMPNPDSDCSKNEARSPHFKKHKKAQPQSQGTRRKDTRC